MEILSGITTRQGPSYEEIRGGQGRRSGEDGQRKAGKKFVELCNSYGEILYCA
jgi:hypothetical protein